MLTIASLTFKEALRKKILLAAIILTLLFLAVYGIGVHFMAKDMQVRESSMQQHGDVIYDGQVKAMHEAQKVIFLMLGVYFSSSIVSLLAIFSSVGAVSAEVENGMLHAIMAKPIRRRNIILGKFIGYALMLVIYAALLFIAVVALNHYMLGTSLIGLSYVVGLFILQPLVLLTVTIAGSTRLSTLANGITAFMIYTVGVIGGMAEQIGAIVEIDALKNTGIITSLIMPVDSLYRMIVNVIATSSGNPLVAISFGPFGAVSSPNNAMIVYTVIYLLAFLLIAVKSFNTRDVG